MSRGDPLPAGQRPVVGVTGLPCSGKSFAARLLADGKVTGERGRLVMADDLGHRVLLLPEIRNKIRERLGHDVYDSPDDKAVRARIAERVFGHPDRLAWLESVIHPAVTRETEAVIRDAGGREMVVVESALLLAANMGENCDVVLLVEADLTTRLARAATRGWDEAELARRESRLVGQYLPERLTKVGSKLARIANDTDGEALIERLKAALRVCNAGA